MPSTPAIPYRQEVAKFCVLLAVLTWVALPAGGAESDQPPTAPKPQLPFRYDRHFGENPFLPSQAQSATGTFLRAEQFTKAEWCAKCHQDVHRQWRESAHANSFRAPFYLKNVQLLIDTKGIEYSRHCEGCHNPIALFSGALTKGAKVDRSFDADGVTCMVCHSIQKVQSTSGTGSYVMGVPAVMLNEDGSPVTGKVDYEDILARPELHKRAMMRDFYRTSEFCGVCHKAAVPRQLNDYKWLRAFNVYDEWQQSSWARESPLPFYKKDTVSTCQTCHMKRVAVSDAASPMHQAALHRWPGANTAIPFFYGYRDQLQQVTEFLRDDILGIDIFGLEKNGGDPGLVAPLGTQPFRLAAGDEVTISVVIQNKKIGHAYVPEQRDFYESWVQLRATDAAGRTLYDSGFLKPDGFLDERAHSYTNRLISKEGKLLDRHQVWETRARAFDNTILPGRSNLARYRFRIPVDAKGPVTVSAKIWYRRFRRGYNNFILGKSVDYPIVEVAARSIALDLGENPVAGGGLPDPMLRWNNYGIALLDQQQYTDAAQAFRRVVQLKPEYADGWTNIAIAEFSNQDYAEASRALEKTSALDPGNLRVLFYAAMIDQVQGRLGAAAERFKQVIDAYPRLRQARQELGYVYYQQGKLSLARAQYEALQAIDPDDLSAHYNLTRIYRRLGLKEKAAQQAGYFADRKDDPSANAYAEAYLRAHPEIAVEGIPFHLHLAPDPGARGAPDGDPKKR